MTASNLPPGCNSPDGLTSEQREAEAMLEKLQDDIAEWVEKYEGDAREGLDILRGRLFGPPVELDSAGKRMVLLPEEPVFVIRAQDNCALKSLARIAEAGFYPGAGMETAIGKFVLWRQQHPEDVKDPD